MSAVTGARLLERRLEWLEADGLGGFASGTPSGVRTRRYHGLLAVAHQPPSGRAMLVNALETWIDLGAGPRALSSHRYGPDVVHPDGERRLVAFDPEPMPTWTFELEGGRRVVQRLCAVRGKPLVVVTWTIEGGAVPGARLWTRPLMSARDLHGTVREGDFGFDARVEGERVTFRPRPWLPPVVAIASGTYRHEPSWYRNFDYEEERARGFDGAEDLASPGVFELDLSEGKGCLVLAVEADGLPPLDLPALRARELGFALVEGERRRRAALDPLDRAAEQYLVKRGTGSTIVAGYPWFADWGRDTFLALRGLCLATGRLDDARSILLEWAGAVSEGMLPNRFVEYGDQPEYNSVDAALWYCVAVDETLRELAGRRRAVPEDERRRLGEALCAILAGHLAGTRHGIRADADGLLAAGEPGWQLTWMDARAVGREVTPRIGKPVEVQALWVNALHAGARFQRRWRAHAERAARAFAERFWNEERGCLFDVVDEDHAPGRCDGSVRPNQLLAIGGLPRALLDGPRARRVVDLVERELWTPLGPRSLAPGDPRYVAHYVGGPSQRDAGYHQGTVWPWLAGPFVEAWVRVRGGGPDVVHEARRRFLQPLVAHLDDAGLGHVSEIADAEPPHVPRGAPFQAWSLGELLRLDRRVLVDDAPAPREATAGAR